jgi:hypothetical protein
VTQKRPHSFATYTVLKLDVASRCRHSPFELKFVLGHGKWKHIRSRRSLIMTNEIYGYSLWQHGAHDFAADA